jgi:LysM repeat protein
MIVDQLFTTYTVVGNNRQFFSESRLERETAKKAKQRKLAESMLMEDPVFRQARQFGQLLVEYNLTKAQVQQLFKDVEQGATAAGGNRTGLGKAKDATTQAIGSVQKMLASARKWVKDRPTYQAVDAEYNKAMAALGKAGGENGEANAITKAIYKYRDAAKNYPRAAGLAKWAIITAAGFATGGLGGVGVAAGLAAIDSALKDKEIVDIVGDAGIAALVSGGIQGAGDLASAASDAYNGVPSAADITANNAALGDWNDTAIPGGPASNSNINGLDLPNTAGDPDFYNNPSNTPPVPGEYSDAANNAYQQNPDPSDAPVDPNTRADYTQPDAGGGTYTVTADDFKGLGKIAQDNGLTAQQLWDANPQITDPDKIFIGQEINIPAASGEPVKNVWQDWEGPTKSTAPPVEPGPTDTVPAVTAPPVEPGPTDTVPAVSATSSQPMLSFPDGGNSGTLTLPDGREVQAYAFPEGGVQPRLGPGGETVQVNYAGQDVTAYIRGDKAYIKNFNPAEFSNPVQESWVPAIKLRHLPADQLIDQKLTVMAWALNESVNRKGQQNVHLTTKGVRTVFENIGRYRRAYLKEYIGAPTADYGHPTAPGAPASATAGQGKPQGWFGRGLDAIGRGVDKVGNYVSNVGHNVITKVTADKLNNMWNRAGEPYDSDRLYQLLTTEWGVPKEVVGSVYGKMGIPYTAPATVPDDTPAPQRGAGIQTGDIYAIDPDTGKPYEKEKLARMYGSGATPSQISAADGVQQPALTGGPTAGLPPATGTTPAPGKITQPNNTTSFNASNVMQMKGMEKYAKPAATGTATPANTTTTASTTGKFPGEDPTGPNYVGRLEVKRRQAARAAAAGNSAAKPTTPQATSTTAGAPSKVTYGGLLAPKKSAAAKAQPVAETIKQVKKMLETVQTRDDVAFIKKYINRQFSGQLSESADAQRSHLLNEVTRIGALRRRTHSQQLAR